MQEQAHDLDSLAAFVEGRLDEHDRQRVMAHVADCPECRRTLVGLGRAMADGALAQAASRATRFHWSNTRIWLPIAASILVGTFAWFQFAMSPQIAGEGQSTGEDASEAAPADEQLLRRRSGGRTVEGKTFRLTTGEWVDASFDPASALPTVVIRGAEERSVWLARVPALAPYAQLGDRVLVVWQGTVYRFEP